MRTMLLTLIAAAALAAPVAALADTAPTAATVANQFCKQQLATLKGDFAKTYGTNATKSNAFGKCVSKIAKTQSQNADAAKNSCKTEQAADPEAFKNKYGTNKNKNNAFGKCVSAQAKAADQEDQSNTINAAKQCKAERKEDPAAFKDKYGTNKNKRNAFGKCVSAMAKAQQDSQPTT